jgi:hypothetical protein
MGNRYLQYAAMPWKKSGYDREVCTNISMFDIRLGYVPSTFHAGKQKRWYSRLLLSCKQICHMPDLVIKYSG